MFPENNPQRELEGTFRHLDRITGKYSTQLLYMLIAFTSTCCISSSVQYECLFVT